MLRNVMVCLAVCGVGSGVFAAHPGLGTRQETAAEQPPALPSGAVRIVNYAWHGTRVAICAEEPGPAIAHGPRSWLRTRVWVHDGHTTRQVGTEPGTCDPAWSPDGHHVAVVAPGGLWVLSPDLRTTTHLVDARHPAGPANEFALRILSQPRWAPDASALAFLVSNGGTSWVEVVNVHTGEMIYASDPETYQFSWGVDSRSLELGSRVVRLP